MDASSGGSARPYSTKEAEGFGGFSNSERFRLYAMSCQVATFNCCFKK